MKKILAALFCLALIVGIGTPLSAETSATQPQVGTSSQALSPEEVAKAKSELKALAEAFGVNQAPATASSAPQSAGGDTPHKTVGDVADKALDMVSKTVASLASTLEKVAPHIWRIMVRQQYAKAIGELLVPWGLVLLCLVYMVAAHKALPYGEEDKRDTYWDGGDLTSKGWKALFRSGIPGGFCVIFGTWGLVRLSDSIMYLVNPEYYAVRDIVVMLLGQGHGPQ